MGTGGKTPTGTKVRIYPRGTRASPKRRHGHAPSPREVSDLSALPDGLKADYAQRALRTGPGGSCRSQRPGRELWGWAIAFSLGMALVAVTLRPPYGRKSG